jgi:2-oxoglutarate ferredoxin oxidoreductase subunit alpha
MDRLIRKWNTAKEMVPQPEFYRSGNTPVSMSAMHESGLAGRTGDGDKSVPAPFGVIYFGTSTYAAEEALDLLADENILLDAMRVRAFPFGKAFVEFVNAHERVFVIEQNRDAQFRSLMMIELGINPAKLVSVLNYDGTPITADDIVRQISNNLNGE